MGRRRTGVNKVRDIIRYGKTTDLSERQIARALGVSRTVVARTLQAFRASGLEYPAVEQIPDSELQQNLERGIGAVVFVRMFLEKSVVDALGSMSLFETHPAILFQPLLDLRFPRIELGWGLLSLYR